MDRSPAKEQKPTENTGRSDLHPQTQPSSKDSLPDRPPHTEHGPEDLSSEPLSSPLGGARIPNPPQGQSNEPLRALPIDTPQQRIINKLQAGPPPDTPQKRISDKLRQMPPRDTPQQRIIDKLLGKTSLGAVRDSLPTEDEKQKTRPWSPEDTLTQRNPGHSAPIAPKVPEVAAKDKEAATAEEGFTEGRIVQPGSLRLHASLDQMNRALADPGYLSGILVDMPTGTSVLVHNSTLHSAKKQVIAHVGGRIYPGWCSGHPSEIRLLPRKEKKKTEKQEERKEQKEREATKAERIEKIQSTADKSGNKGLDFDSSREDYIDFIRGLSGFGAGGLATTGSLRLEMELKFAALGEVVWGAGRAEIGGKMAFDTTIDVQDDRRLRATGGVEITGFGEGSVLWDLAKVGLDLKLKFSLTGVYESPEHFAVYLRAKVLEFLAGLTATIEKKGFEAPEKIASAGDHLEEASADVNHYGEILTLLEGRAMAEGHVAASLAGGSTTVQGAASRSSIRALSPSKGRSRPGGTTEYAFQVSIDIAGLGGATLEIAHSATQDHPNPDNDGQYLNVKAFIHGSAKVDKKELQLLIEGIDLGQRGRLDLHVLETFAGRLAEGLRKKMEALKVPSHYDLSGQRKKGLLLELNYVQSAPGAEYALQYFRTTYKKVTEYNSETEMSYGPGAASAGLSTGVTLRSTWEAGIFEVMGSNTLSYVSTVYNGLMNRKSGDRRDWDTYMTLHFKGLRDIALQLGDPLSNARTEYRSKGLHAEDYIAHCEQARGQYGADHSLEKGLEVQLVKGLESYILIPLRKQVKQDTDALYNTNP